MAWKQPATDVEWTAPEGDVPFDESRDMMPGDLSGVTPQGIQGQQQAAPAGVSWYEAFFPKSTAEADAPAYAPRALDAAWRDVASLPGRAYASTTRPQGERFLDAMARTSPPEDASGAWSVTDAILRDELLAPGLALGSVRAPAWLAARAPAWLRGAIAGNELAANVGSRTAQAIRAAGKAAPGGAVIAGLSQSERMARGDAPDAFQAGATFAAAPVVAAAGPTLQGLGGAMKRGGVQALRQMVKPTTTELEGFYRAMDAGLLPEAAGMFTLTPGGAGERYIQRMKVKTDAAYAPAVAEAERTGATVNMDRVMREASRDLTNEADQGYLALSDDDLANVRDWLGGKLLRRDAAGRDALEIANVPYQGRYVPLMGQEEVRSTVATGAPINAERLALGLPQGEVRRSVVSGYKPVVQGFEKLPDYYEPIPDVVRPVTPAHRLKSAMQEAAYPGRDPKATAPIAGTRAGAKAADRAIRAQISEVSPAYAAADAQVAPWYAGADAFQRAADVRGGNYGVDLMAGLIGGGAGSQTGIANGIGGLIGAAGIARYVRSPALARHMWEMGRASQAVGSKLPRRAALGAFLQQSATDNARGR